MFSNNNHRYPKKDTNTKIYNRALLISGSIGVLTFGALAMMILNSDLSYNSYIVQDSPLLPVCLNMTPTNQYFSSCIRWKGGFSRMFPKALCAAAFMGL